MNIDNIFPIGSIYLSVDSVNPGTIFQGTTWIPWGEGRVPVGVADNGTFNTVEKTGGAETHTLTSDEMALHEHQTTSRRGQGLPSGDPYHWIGLREASGLTSTDASSIIPQIYATGGGQAHNNMQPYITCYMWARTA